MSDFQPEETLTTYLLVQSKEVRAKKNSGDPYLALVLSDKTGQIEAKMWDGVEEIADTFERDDFVKIKGNIQVYRDRPQLIVHLLRPADDEEIDIGDFLPHTEYDIDEMFNNLLGNVRAYENAQLRRLVLSFLEDEEIAKRFRRAPAAKTLHHAKIGGLLEHVTSLMNLASLLASNYDYLDRDLLQTGVVLHDLGKIYELGYDRSFGYTDEGQLLGHITIVLLLLERKCNQIGDIPVRLRLLVQHMILSHHGKYEFGSPKLPMFPEALALSYIDDLDSKLEGMRAQVATDQLIGGNWTRYNPSLDRSVLKKEAFLSDSEVVAPKAAPSLPGAPPRLPDSSPAESNPASAEDHSSQEPHNRGLFAERLDSAIRDKS